MAFCHEAAGRDLAGGRIWYMMRKQAMLDKKYREENEKAGQAHGSEPVPRLVERSNIIIAVAAMLLIIIVLILGNQSTL